MEVPEVKRLKTLEEESARLKKLLAETMLDSALNYQTPSEFAAGWRNGKFEGKQTDVTN